LKLSGILASIQEIIDVGDLLEVCADLIPEAANTLLLVIEELMILVGFDHKFFIITHWASSSVIFGAR
jgi:hypothetical protein